MNIEDIICVAPILAKSHHYKIDLTSFGYGIINCGLYCSDGNAYNEMYYSDNDQQVMDAIRIIMSVIGSLLSILLCIHLTCIHRHKTRFGNYRPKMRHNSSDTHDTITDITANSNDIAMKISSAQSSRISFNFSRNQIIQSKRASKIESVVRQKNKKSRGFIYQTPFVINIAYILFLFPDLLIHIVGTKKIMCNPDENTVANPNHGNHLCTFSGILLNLSFYTLTLYTMALLFALTMTLYYPLKVKKMKHTWIWHAILMGIIAVIGIYLVSNNYVAAGTFGCSVSLRTTGIKHATPLFVYFVPSAIGTAIIPTLLIINVMKLRKMSKSERYQTGTGSKLTEFYWRYIIYSLCIMIFMITYFSVSLYYYVHAEDWDKHGKEWVTCAIQHISTGRVDEVDNNCKHVPAAAVCQMLSFCLSLPVILGGWVLQLTKSNIEFWCLRFKTLSSNIFDLSGSRSQSEQRRIDEV